MLVCHLLQHLLGGGQFLPMFLQRTFQVFDLLSLCFYLVGQDAHLKGDTGLTSAEGEHETMVQNEILNIHVPLNVFVYVQEFHIGIYGRIFVHLWFLYVCNQVLGQNMGIKK